MKSLRFAVCALLLSGMAAPAVATPPDDVRAFVATHRSVRARLSPEDRRLMDVLCVRVRAALPLRARLPDDVRAVIARSVPGLSREELEVLTDYVSGDANIAGMYGTASIGGNRTLSAERQMQETQMSFNLQYLQLQNQMQNENRQYTMVSNILKTKHDTVKNSIGNIR